MRFDKLKFSPPGSRQVDVNLVNVAFIARNPSGTLIRNLTKDDIEVFEDGAKQEIQFLSRSEDLPLRLGLVVDASGSQDKFIQAASPRHRRLCGWFHHTPRPRSSRLFWQPRARRQRL